MDLHELRYTKEHEWARIEGDIIVVGITDHAQSELGDITFIELPAPGKEVSQNDSLATLESVKAASDVYAPVSGAITDVNGSLEDSPETINRSAYEDGWICRIKPADMADIESLMSYESYQDYISAME